MLGQTILDSFADIDSADSSYCLPHPPTGLPIRRIKSAGLRIITEGDALSFDSPTAHMNTLRPPNNRHSCLSARTPDTSYTFGRPNPSMLVTKSFEPLATPQSSTPSPVVLAARRRSRYAQAESALRSVSQVTSAEISPQELKIRALEKATSLLSEQARDAQACAAKLRLCLAVKGDNSLSPDEVKTLQRERWFEERRGSARQNQSALTRNLLTKLCSPVSEGPPSPPVDSSTLMTRHQVNLATFMQLSPTCITFPQSRSPSIRPIVTYRRQTISQIRPLRLRASALQLALRSPIKPRVRSKSLDGTHSRRNSDSTDATFVSEDPSEQTAVTAPRPLILQLDLKMPPSPLALSPSVGIGGIVLIEKSECRSRGQLLAEVGDVPLPGYAVDLLGDLDLVAASPDFNLPALVPLPIFRPSSPTSSESEYEPTLRTSGSAHDHNGDDRLSPSALFRLPPVRPPSPLHLAGHMRSQSDNVTVTITTTTTTTPSTPIPSPTLPLRRPETTKGLGLGHLRTAGAAQVLSFYPHTAPVSLGTVPEAATSEVGMTEFEPRPQTSMSDYVPVSAERGEESFNGFGFGNRFSMATFKRRRRFNSESGSVHSGGDGSSNSGVGPTVTQGIPFPTSPTNSRSVSGSERAKGIKSKSVDLDAPGEDGILARFKKRVHRFGHQQK